MAKPKKGVTPPQLKAWNAFVDAMAKKNPSKTRSEVMKMAKEPYKKWKKSQGL